VCVFVASGLLRATSELRPIRDPGSRIGAYSLSGRSMQTALLAGGSEWSLMAGDLSGHLWILREHAVSN
jgi:hypothetical protein